MSEQPWNVISAGPSRQFLTPNDLLPGPVVSINRAVDVMDRGIGVDFAMFADPPHKLAEVIDFTKYLNPPIQVWCPCAMVMIDGGVTTLHDMAALWEPYLPASVGLRVTPNGSVETEVKGKTRFIFAMLMALERVCLFRPKMVRILCADMMGSWAPNMTEAECEMHQSELEQFRRRLGQMQKRVTDTKGKDLAAVYQRDQFQALVNDLTKKGDPVLFKRWEHERRCLKELEARANKAGIQFEWRTPSSVVTA